MDKAQLLAQARAYLPDADTIKIEEVVRGPAPFKLVAWKRGNCHWTHFKAEDLFLACKLVGNKLAIGTYPERKHVNPARSTSDPLSFVTEDVTDRMRVADPDPVPVGGGGESAGGGASGDWGNSDSGGGGGGGDA